MSVDHAIKLLKEEGHKGPVTVRGSNGVISWKGNMTHVKDVGTASETELQEAVRRLKAEGFQVNYRKDDMEERGDAGGKTYTIRATHVSSGKTKDLVVSAASEQEARRTVKNRLEEGWRLSRGDSMRDCMDALAGIGRRMDALQARRRDRRADAGPRIHPASAQKAEKHGIKLENYGGEVVAVWQGKVIAKGSNVESVVKQAMIQLQYPSKHPAPGERYPSSKPAAETQPSLISWPPRKGRLDDDELPMNQGEREAAFR